MYFFETTSLRKQKIFIKFFAIFYEKQARLVVIFHFFIDWWIFQLDEPLKYAISIDLLKHFVRHIYMIQHGQKTNNDFSVVKSVRSCPFPFILSSF